MLSEVLSGRDPLGGSGPRGSQARLKAGLERLQRETANHRWKREEMDRVVFMTPEPVFGGHWVWPAGDSTGHALNSSVNCKAKWGWPEQNHPEQERTRVAVKPLLCPILRSCWPLACMSSSSVTTDPSLSGMETVSLWLPHSRGEARARQAGG